MNSKDDSIKKLAEHLIRAEFRARDYNKIQEENYKETQQTKNGKENSKPNENQG
ncbi:MAG: hypothetical protein PVG93_04235 [Phycisphaerales bacterium]